MNVRMLDVSDEEAIRLGNISVDDTESGGHKRIEAHSTSSRLVAGGRMSEYFNRLFEATEDDMSLVECIRQNGFSVLKWMNEIGVINDSQFRTAVSNMNRLQVLILRSQA